MTVLTLLIFDVSHDVTSRSIIMQRAGIMEEDDLKKEENRKKNFKN
jgi:hypothetical protein